MKSVSSFFSVFLLLAAVGFLTACNPKTSNNVAALPTVLAETASFTYETFSEERFNALKGTEEFSVFVHSVTCGTCAKKNKQIIDEVSTFNAGTILKLEYSEASKEFLQIYDVSKYDTFVNFDADGNATTVKGAEVDSVRSFLTEDSSEAPESLLEAIVPTVHAQSDTFVYQDFDDATYEALRGTEPFAIFFHSVTCGTCAKKNKQIIDEVADFTSGTILKLEYSEAPTELLKEFGVSKYDTFVVFSADGTPETLKGGLVDDVRDSL